MPSQELYDRAYTERAIVIKLLLLRAKELGYEYGYRNEISGSDRLGISKIIYVELPEGQFSWHIAPQDWDIFEGVKEFRGTWDGSSNGKNKEFVKGLCF